MSNFLISVDLFHTIGMDGDVGKGQFCATSGSCKRTSSFPSNSSSFPIREQWPRVVCLAGYKSKTFISASTPKQEKCAQYWPTAEETEMAFRDTGFLVTVLSEDVKSYYTTRVLELQNLSVGLKNDRGGLVAIS